MKQLIVKLAGALVLAAVAFLAASAGGAYRFPIACALGIPSLALAIINRRQLGRSFAVGVEAKALVTKGLYSRIRHPMYLFVDLFLAALIIASGWPILLALWGLFVLFQTIKADREEKALAGAFGEEYGRYRARTWF